MTAVHSRAVATRYTTLDAMIEIGSTSATVEYHGTHITRRHGSRRAYGPVPSRVYVLIYGNLHIHFRFRKRLPETGLPSFDTVIHNGACIFNCMWHSSQNLLVQYLDIVD